MIVFNLLIFNNYLTTIVAFYRLMEIMLIYLTKCLYFYNKLKYLPTRFNCYTN
jgi:hypothetical protein